MEAKAYSVEESQEIKILAEQIARERIAPHVSVVNYYTLFVVSHRDMTVVENCAGGMQPVAVAETSGAFRFSQQVRIFA